MASSISLPSSIMRKLGSVANKAVDRLKSAVGKRGLLGAVASAARAARAAIRSKARSCWVRMLNRIAAWRFDRPRGIDTGGWIEPRDLGSPSENVKRAVAYTGTLPRAFRRVLAQLPIDFGSSLFIDYGSGKGRALFLATEFPFRGIVGVEFSPVLHKIATANKERYQNPRQECREIKLICADAVDYTIPEQPAVLFFFNPFDATVMKRIAARVDRSLRLAPRDLWVIYFWPKAVECWDNMELLERCPVRQPAWHWPAHRQEVIVAVWRSRNELVCSRSGIATKQYGLISQNHRCVPR